MNLRDLLKWGIQGRGGSEPLKNVRGISEMKRTAIAAIGLAMITLPVLAQAKTYVGMDYAMANYEMDTGFDTLDIKPTALRMRLGSTLNDYLAIELHGAFGLSDDTDTVDVLGESISAQYEIDSALGVFIKARAPVGERFGLFAMLGYSRLEGSYRIDAPSVAIVESGSESESDVSMGLGADFRMTDRLYLNADYLQLLDKSGVEVTSLNLGLRLDF